MPDNHKKDQSSSGKGQAAEHAFPYSSITDSSQRPTPCLWAARLIICAATGDVTRMKSATVNAFTPMGENPTFRSMLNITPKAPRVPILVVVCNLLYTSGSLASPSIARNTKNSPMTRTTLLSVSSINAKVLRIPPLRQGILQRLPFPQKI